jgi:hypothetical protein
MGWRARWTSPIIAVAVTAGGPAWARHDMQTLGLAQPTLTFSTHTSRPRTTIRINGPAVVARRAPVREHLHRPKFGPVQGGLPIAVWTYGPPVTGTAAPAVEAAPPPQPEVIVMAAPHDATAETARSEAPPDYSYVAGCHAIPNGYHCDVPPGGETTR